MDLYYVTGNKLKVKLANQVFSKYGINVIQEDMDFDEIQSLDCEVVANTASKALANLLNKPVLKNDSGLFIDCLDGFPGALSKFCESNIKASGYIKLLEGIENRNCHWVEVLSYCEPGGEPVCFTSISSGTISEDVRETDYGYDFDKIFIPLGDTRTFSQMGEEEHVNFFNQDAYDKMALYLIENRK